MGKGRDPQSSAKFDAYAISNLAQKKAECQERCFMPPPLLAVASYVSSFIHLKAQPPWWGRFHAKLQFRLLQNLVHQVEQPRYRLP